MASASFLGHRIGGTANPQKTQTGPTKILRKNVEEKDLAQRRLDRVAAPRPRNVASKNLPRNFGNRNLPASPGLLSKDSVTASDSNYGSVSTLRAKKIAVGSQYGNSGIRSNNLRLTKDVNNLKLGPTTATASLSKNLSTAMEMSRNQLKQNAVTQKSHTVNQSSRLADPSYTGRNKPCNQRALLVSSNTTTQPLLPNSNSSVGTLTGSSNYFGCDTNTIVNSYLSKTLNSNTSRFPATSNRPLGNNSNESSRSGKKQGNGVTSSKSVDSLDTQALSGSSGNIEEISSAKEYSEDSDLSRLEAVITEKERLLHEKEVLLELLKDKLCNRDTDLQDLRCDLENVQKNFHELTKAQNEETVKHEKQILDLKQHYEQEVSQLRKGMSSIEKECENRRQEQSALEATILELEHKNNLVNAETAELTKKLIKAQKDYEEADSKYREELESSEALRLQIASKEVELKELKHEMTEVEAALSVEKAHLSNERDEWQQFQEDMLMVVKVAEEFRAEAATKIESVQQENFLLREQLELARICRETRDACVQVSGPVCRNHCVSPDQMSMLSDSNDNQICTNVESTAETLTLQLNNQEPMNEADCSDKENKRNLFSAANPSVVPTIDENSTRENSLSEKRILRSAYNSDSRRNCSFSESDKSDPLAALVKITGGSRRNALLKWCQSRTANYSQVDITNFSTSWCDGMALCALLHSFLPNLVPYDSLSSDDREKNFKIALRAAESVGISANLDMNEMIADRPIWEDVMNYVKEIYVRLGRSPQ